MRYSPNSSLLLAAFSTGMILVAIGLYRPAPEHTTRASSWVDSTVAAADTSKADASRPRGQRTKRASQPVADRERLHKLAPLLVLLPVLAKHTNG
ncbi:MAG: hypothetical protein EBZ48_05910 [Proteobacteria bacterium]|nr:hypothetical protein [Pseudomonadota bacterium]